MLMMFSDAKPVIIAKFMLKYERQQFILKLIGNGEPRSVQTLTADTGASKITIQRDLAELEEEGRLKRIHGGAVLENGGAANGNGEIPSIIPKSVRQTEYIPEKRAICRAAAGLITEEDTICIDPSTTCSFLVDYMPDLPVHTVTPSIETFLLLTQKKNVQSILTGGRLNKKTQNLIGRSARRNLREFYFSICFISADGFDMDRGSLEFDYEDSAVKQTMIEAADKVVLLINSTKVNRTKGLLTCDKNRIDFIFTDAQTAIDWPDELASKVHTVSREQRKKAQWQPQ